MFEFAVVYIVSSDSIQNINYVYYILLLIFLISLDIDDF